MKKQSSAHVGGDFESDVCDEIERKGGVVGWRRDIQVLETNLVVDNRTFDDKLLWPTHRVYM